MSRHNEQPNTLARQEHEGKIYVKNIRRSSCRIGNRIRIQKQLKSRIRHPKKIIPDPQHWSQYTVQIT
jgi:hypothetical protein